MNAVDTNILVYAHDSNEPTKQLVAKQLIDSLIGSDVRTVLLWQVASEFLNYLQSIRRKGFISEADVEKTIREIIRSFPVYIPDSQTLDHYLSLFKRFSLSHWDCMLLAACRTAGVTTLYSEDMATHTDFDGVRIVNPFAGPTP